ncbi:MAG: ABC transporter ATP-binding protein [Spirochaetia bacterium]|jgi:putative ABC transport system ATP-binding protein|nr:ABC transporter ATP-binding protein [Spirochaetia bacterium]
MNILLESKKLSKHYNLGKNNRINVLKEVNLQIERGEFATIMGPSGSGKSTLLYNLCGMDRMSSGRVNFNGKELSDLSEKSLAALRLKEMGFIFQQIHLLKNLSIQDNIILSGYLQGRKSRRDINKRAQMLMEMTGIESLAQNDITQASGGQLQRVGICRALINEPDIIFGDEPTGALDSLSSCEIMELLRTINNSGTTVLLVTHDPKVASKSDRVLYMVDGQIVSEKKIGRYTGNKHEALAREKNLTEWLFAPVDEFKKNLFDKSNG